MINILLLMPLSTYYTVLGTIPGTLCALAHLILTASLGVCYFHFLPDETVLLPEELDETREL